MKIRSSHNFDAWRTQLERTRRWHRRLKKIKPEGTHVVSMHIAEDYLYAFFQNCWHLCEWVQKSKIVAGPKIKHLFDSHEELRLCRDICNGTKHMTITRPSVDSQFTTFREYDWLQPSMAEGPNSNQKLMVRAAGQKHDMFVLADQCMKIWDDFLEPILTQQKNEPNRVSAPN